MIRREITRGTTLRRFFLSAVIIVLLSSSVAAAADVIVLGDTQLAPVASIIAGMRETLDIPIKVYTPAQVKDRLKGVAAREEAKVVVALGREALDEALRLPSSVAVIYGLVITPPQVNRQNTTGFYMATPVREYVALARKYLPSLRRIAVVGSADLLRSSDVTADPQVSAHKVRSSYELAERVRQLDNADALVLLPDVSLLTASAMEEVLLSSFRRGIPVLGVSEKNVRQGSLLALVFDPLHVGRQIGTAASEALRGEDVGRVPPSPPQRFDLFINTTTAEKLHLAVPGELLRKARKVYP